MSEHKCRATKIQALDPSQVERPGTRPEVVAVAKDFYVAIVNEERKAAASAGGSESVEIVNDPSRPK